MARCASAGLLVVVAVFGKVGALAASEGRT